MSDIAFKKPLPEPFANNIKYWTGCIAGAQTVDEMRAQLKAAGFAQIDIIDSKSDLNVYKSEKNSSTEANKGGMRFIYHALDLNLITSSHQVVASHLHLPAVNHLHLRVVNQMKKTEVVDLHVQWTFPVLNHLI